MKGSHTSTMNIAQDKMPLPLLRAKQLFCVATQASLRHPRGPLPTTGRTSVPPAALNDITANSLQAQLLRLVIPMTVMS